MDEECALRNSGYNITSQLYSSKATSIKQHGHAAAGSSRKASSMTTAWKRYLGHHSQPSNTAL